MKRRKKTWLRVVALTVVALALAALFSLTGGYQRLSLAILDSQQRLAAEPHYARDALLVDIDEESLQRLKPILGPWPYSRDIFAMVTEYLHAAGAKAIVYDIVFADGRDGDARFAEAIREAGNVSLASVGLPNVLSAVGASSGQGGEACAAAGVPIKGWPDVLLPAPQLAAAVPGRIGIISAVPDVDGALRRMDMLHVTRQRCIPHLALSALTAEAPITVRSVAGGTSLAVGEHRWPVDANGETRLYYPNNTDVFPVLPFQRLALEVLGAPGQGLSAGEFRGKTVFIGSTAGFFADSVNTPHGQLPGLWVLALTHQNLAHDLWLAGAGLGWNMVMLVLALAIPVLAATRRTPSTWAINGAALLGAALAACLHYLLLRVAHVQADLPFVLVSLLLLVFLLSPERVWQLARERQRLINEKRVAVETNQLKSQFLANMTHELRTPLTAIIGFNRLLGEERLVSPEGKRYLDTIQANGEHLLGLINNLLDQAKVEAGQMNVCARPTQLHGLIQGVADTLSGLAQAKGIQLRVEYAEGFPAAVNVDPMRLRQILLNLGGNAVKFTDDGAVTFQCHWLDDTLTIGVRDTGPGISEEDQRRLFEAFYQAGHTKGGTGLGLMISRTLAHLMGGQITIESGLGEGTCFTLRVAAPKVVPAAPEAPVPAEAGLELAKPAPRTVLLVEDTEDVRMLMEIYLAGMGYQVLAAENGKLGLEVAVNQQPDIVLMDLEMPVMDGKQAVQAMRRAGYARPVVAMTAHTVDAMRAELIELGFTDCLTKTADRRTIQAALEHHLAEAG